MIAFFKIYVFKKNEYNKKLYEGTKPATKTSKTAIVVAPRQQPALADGADRAANVARLGQVTLPREASAEATTSTTTSRSHYNGGLTCLGCRFSVFI